MSIVKKKRTIYQSIKKEIKNFIKKIYWSNYTNIKYLYKSFSSKKLKLDNLISILTITRYRPEKFENLVNSIIENTNNLKNLEMIVLIDMDEKYEKNYSSIVEKFKSKFNIRLIQIDIEKNTQKNNYLSKISKGDLLFIVADDMIFIKNWDICINEEANKFDKFKPFMIWPKEKGFKYPFLHNNAPIINRVWFNKCGFFQPEELHHFYADNWMCDIGRKYGQFIITKDVIYDHLHSEKKDGLIDETHRNTMKRSKNYNEEKIYNELKNLQNDVVKRLLN